MINAIVQQPRPLGRHGQTPRRQLECRVRRRALALARWASRHGVTPSATAHRLGIAQQTMSRWQSRCGGLPRGRPVHVVVDEVCESVRELLSECRGHLGVPSLKACFTDVPRSALAAIRARYLAEHDGSMEYLTWAVPGSVWAADFTEPEVPIDGCYRYVLSVRDLASCYQLLLLPVRQADANAVTLALTHLFTAHGPPLVLKTDNGSPFLADNTFAVLWPREIMHLVSPPLTPWYNGAIEAGIGAVKSRALLVAASHGRADCWNADDLEAARHQANHQARPFGRTGPSPQERWYSRSPITAEQRQAFLASVAQTTHDEALKMIQRAQARAGFAPDEPFTASERASVARRAIRRALLELGFLFVRRVAN